MEQQKRQTAYKIPIGELLKQTPSFADDKFNYIEIAGKKVARVSIIANVISKYVSQEKSYISLTIDDGTGQIRIKLFDKLTTPLSILEGLDKQLLAVILGKRTWKQRVTEIFQEERSLQMLKQLLE